MAKNKKITINDLAEAVKAGFEKSAQNIDSLAGMVNRGFNDVQGQINEVKQDIGLLKQGQERIEMRLHNVVYRSELDAVLDRVELLEQKMETVLKKK